MIFCFDLDNVICDSKTLDYSKSTPHIDVINKINSLYDEGNKILIFTARYMGRNNENVDLAVKQGYESTEIQLKLWKIQYHVLIMGKPSYDLFVDDKAYGYSGMWIKDLRNKYL